MSAFENPTPKLQKKVERLKGDFILVPFPLFTVNFSGDVFVACDNSAGWNMTG